MPTFEPKDHYFHKAKLLGYKARSVFKLEEIDKSLNIIKPGSVVLDLGAYPGSFLQYIEKKLGPKGKALGVDLLPINGSFGPNIKSIVSDVFLLNKEKIASILLVSSVDLIISDMAPKTTGIKHVDQIRSFDLAKKTYELALELLKTEGSLLIKVFNSNEVNELILSMKKTFKTVKQLRPKGIRSMSKEFYILGLSKKGNI